MGAKNKQTKQKKNPNCIILNFRSWIFTIDEESVCVHLRHCPSLGFLLLGILVQIPAPLGNM